MGAIHEETLGQNKGKHEWEVINLGQLKTIKTLIKYRSQLDEFYIVKEGQSDDGLSSNGTPTFHEIVINMYLDLENLIRKTPLTLQQQNIINMLMKGYTEKDIGLKMGCDETNVMKVFYSACKKMKAQNDRDWHEWLETSGLVKTEGNYKQCAKCDEFYKLNEDNFYREPKGKDGYKKVCKSCTSSKKRQ